MCRILPLVLLRVQTRFLSWYMLSVPTQPPMAGLLTEGLTASYWPYYGLSRF